MSSGNYKPAFCETFHSYIMEEFHKWREVNKIPINAVLNGAELNTVIATAKSRLYNERPQAIDAGFEDLSA